MERLKLALVNGVGAGQWMCYPKGVPAAVRPLDDRVVVWHPLVVPPASLQLLRIGPWKPIPLWTIDRNVLPDDPRYFDGPRRLSVKNPSAQCDYDRPGSTNLLLAQNPVGFSLRCA